LCETECAVAYAPVACKADVRVFVVESALSGAMVREGPSPDGSKPSMVVGDVSWAMAV